MGTNFYITSRNKELVEKHFPFEYEIVDTPYFGYKIHIGKRSMGWKPIFREHNKAYNSVEELKAFIRKNQKDIHIFDEYNSEFSLEELEDALITWGEQQEIRYMKHIPEGVPDEIFGGKRYLVESTKDDYDITIPFDHMEYEKLEISRNNWRYEGQSRYRKDKEGYDFMGGDFC